METKKAIELIEAALNAVVKSGLCNTLNDATIIGQAFETVKKEIFIVSNYYNVSEVKSKILEAVSMITNEANTENTENEIISKDEAKLLLDAIREKVFPKMFPIHSSLPIS